MENKIAIFVLDDDLATVEALGDLLNAYGYDNVHLFTDYNKLMEALNDNVRICIVDFLLKQDKNGLQVIQEIVKVHPYCFFIMISGQDKKSVVVEFVNSIYGGRYIEKGTNEEVVLIKYVKEFVAHIILVSKIYGGMAAMNNNIDKTLNQLSA